MAHFVVLKDKNLKPENIKSGVKIFKVTGTYEGGGGEGEWDWVVQAKRHEIDDVTNKSLEELTQLEWGACGILSGTEITELPEIDFSEPIATHGLAYSFAGTGISDVAIPVTTNALNAHSCFEGMFFDCNDLEHVEFTDFDVTPYTDGEMSEHFERAFMNAGGNVSPVIEWVDDRDHDQGGVISPGLFIEFPNLTYANSNMFNEAFRGIKGADASFGVLGVEFPSLEKIGGAYTPSNSKAKNGAKAPVPSNNGVKCFYNAFHSSRLYNDSEGDPIDESDMQYGTMRNIFPVLTEIHGNGVFAHAFSRSNLDNFGFPNELTLYLAGESETEGMFECVCRDCKDLHSISLSAKYDPDTVDRNTKVWRDAFDGCDNLGMAYISDTLVAYGDERNILESAPNIQYIELNALPDFDYTINTYGGHDMYFTWQSGLSLQSIWNILNFASNEFQDAEDEPHEIWFYENTILEDNAEYYPDDPNSVQLVDDIMNMKADLESYGWTIHNLYRSASDVPGGGSDWLVDALAGNITDLSGYELPAPTKKYQYYYLFDEYASITALPDMSNWTSISGSYCMEQAFYKCTGITPATLDLSGLTTITGNHALKDCFNSVPISSVDLSGLTTITGQSAFYKCFNGCTSLTYVDLRNLSTVSGSGYSVFQECFAYCTNLDTIRLDSLQRSSDYYNTFQGCNNLKTIYISSAPLNESSQNSNPLYNLTPVENLYLTDNATGNIRLNWQPNLTAASVLNVLTHLDLTVSGKSVNFYSSGLTVTDDAQGSIQTAYDAAVAAGWTINNLTIVQP